MGIPYYNCLCVCVCVCKLAFTGVMWVNTAPGVLVTDFRDVYESLCDVKPVLHMSLVVLVIIIYVLYVSLPPLTYLLQNIYMYI